jgi:hypothetical protein
MGASLISFFGAIISENSQWLGGSVITIIFLYNQFFPRILGEIGRSFLAFLGQAYLYYLFFTNQSKKTGKSEEEEVEQLIDPK